MAAIKYLFVVRIYTYLLVVKSHEPNEKTTVKRSSRMRNSSGEVGLGCGWSLEDDRLDRREGVLDDRGEKSHKKVRRYGSR